MDGENNYQNQGELDFVLPSIDLVNGCMTPSFKVMINHRKEVNKRIDASLKNIPCGIVYQ